MHVALSHSAAAYFACQRSSDSSDKFEIHSEMSFTDSSISRRRCDVSSALAVVDIRDASEMTASLLLTTSQSIIRTCRIVAARESRLRRYSSQSPAPFRTPKKAAITNPITQFSKMKLPPVNAMSILAAVNSSSGLF